MDNRHLHPGNVVLVVEDDYFVRAFAAEILEESGFEVVQARDAAEALATLEVRSDVEVLFTDINMPGRLDGLGLAREVARRWPHVSRLITSGRVNSIDPAPDRFIEKPYQPDVVVENIREMLQGRRRPH